MRNQSPSHPWRTPLRGTPRKGRRRRGNSLWSSPERPHLEPHSPAQRSGPLSLRYPATGRPERSCAPPCRLRLSLQGGAAAAAPPPPRVAGDKQAVCREPSRGPKCWRNRDNETRALAKGPGFPAAPRVSGHLLLGARPPLWLTPALRSANRLLRPRRRISRSNPHER